MNDFKISELERRVANLVLVGTIAELDGSMARVEIGGLRTAALPWLSPRVGETCRVWKAPAVGEQVLVVCRNGDPAQGIIVASLGSALNPHPSGNPRIFKTVFGDGSFLQVDLDTRKMTVRSAGDVDVVANGKAAVTAPTIDLEGNVSISGTLSVAGATALGVASVQGTPLSPGGNQF